MKKSSVVFLVLLLLAGISFAQWRGGGRRWRGAGGGDTGIIPTEGGVPVDVDTVRTAREIASHSSDTANWTNTPGFEKDVLTFVRII